MPDHDREESKQLLLERGLSDEAAEKFLDSKVAYQTLQLKAQHLRDVLDEVAKYGFPFGDVVFTIALPQPALEAFRKGLEAVIAKKGGFVYDNPEQALLASLTPETLN